MGIRKQRREAPRLTQGLCLPNGHPTEVMLAQVAFRDPADIAGIQDRGVKEQAEGDGDQREVERDREKVGKSEESWSTKQIAHGSDPEDEKLG
jgi:hypothetical protein